MLSDTHQRRAPVADHHPGVGEAEDGRREADGGVGGRLAEHRQQQLDLLLQDPVLVGLDQPPGEALPGGQRQRAVQAEDQEQVEDEHDCRGSLENDLKQTLLGCHDQCS